VEEVRGEGINAHRRPKRDVGPNRYHRTAAVLARLLPRLLFRNLLQKTLDHLLGAFFDIALPGRIDFTHNLILVELVSIRAFE